MLSASSLWYLIVCLHVFPSMDARPFRETVYAGDIVTMPCRYETSTNSIIAADWLYSPPWSTFEVELCLNGVCINGFSIRFSVNREEDFKLTIHDVIENDSGNYTCVAFDDSTEYRQITELNVTERRIPNTDVHNNTAASPKDVVLLIASITVGTAVGICCLVIFLVAYRSRLSWFCWKRDLTAAAAQTTMKLENMSYLSSSEARHTSCKENIKSDEAATIDDLVLDSRVNFILAKACLIRFRQKYNKHSAESAVVGLFKTFALVSSLWWNALKAKKQRMRRLIYYERSGYNRRPTRLSPLEPAFAGPVTGVAIMNGKFYIVHRESDTIRVEPDKSEIIVVCGMTWPVDIVVSKAANALYVADELRCCIWVVKIGQRSKKWQELGEYTPQALSLGFGSLLVTTDSNTLLVYILNGKNKLKKVNLPEFMEPRHAIETSRNTFVVCGKRGRGHGVVEFDSNGQELRSFLYPFFMMRFPSYLVADSDGRLLVADFSNNRILLLHPKLEHGCVILNHRRDGIAAPQRLCLDEVNSELLVVQWPSDLIQQFSFRNVSAYTKIKLKDCIS